MKPGNKNKNPEPSTGFRFSIVFNKDSETGEEEVSLRSRNLFEKTEKKILIRKFKKHTSTPQDLLKDE